MSIGFENGIDGLGWKKAFLARKARRGQKRIVSFSHPKRAFTGKSKGFPSII
jgi:hypothetical protein